MPPSQQIYTRLRYNVSCRKFYIILYSFFKLKVFYIILYSFFKLQLNVFISDVDVSARSRDRRSVDSRKIYSL